MSSEEPDRPRLGDDPSFAWNQDEADKLIGQYALVGITYLSPDGNTVESHIQRHGRIVSVDRNSGIKMQCEGKNAGETFNLPPHVQVFQKAKPSTYKLHSTGETVANPDLLATWSVNARAKS